MHGQQSTRNRTQEQATPKLFLLMWHVGVPTNLAIIGVYAFNSEFFAIKREVWLHVSDTHHYEYDNKPPKAKICLIRTLIR